MQTMLRIAVVDDHALFVHGLELLLPDVTNGRAVVVASTGDAAAAASLVRLHVPDVVLVDVHMPPPGGLRAMSAIRRASARVRIVAMSGDEDPESAIEALRAGAEGFLPKSADPRDLLQPLLATLDGWAVIPADLLAVLVGAGATAVPDPSAHLDDDERMLLKLIATGATTTDIGTRLHVSERTVKRLIAALLRKLRVSSRAEAAALAGRTGIL